MKLLIVATETLYRSALRAMDKEEWKIVFPSLYSDTWGASGSEAQVGIIAKYLPRFTEIYIEEGLKLEAITLIQHAIESLSIKEYFLCDFESIDDVQASIQNAYFVDRDHANAKHAEYKINHLFTAKLSRAIKGYALEERASLYKRNSIGFNYADLQKLHKGWHKQLQNYFVLLPTIAGLYWIVKAERNIMAYDPANIHRIYVQYKKDGIEFTIPFETVYTDELIQERNDTVSYLRNPNNQHVVNFYQTEVEDVKPAFKPIVLSFLQSKMFYLYHFSIEYTTKIAKRLHMAGLITDPSTSSYYVPSDTAIEIIRMLNEKYGEKYVLQSQREFKKVLEGKPAILPTNFKPEYYPENIENTPEFKKINFDSSKMKNDAQTMYGFIYALAEWLQMKDAIYDSSILQISVVAKKLEARAHSLAPVYDSEKGQEVEQTCWKNIHQSLLKALSAASGDGEGEERPLVLPKCSFGEILHPTGVDFAVTKPKRPPRYGVGRFNVQILGGKGIGTAETFHIIQNNLVSSGIVTLANTMMNPQEIAMETIAWCEKFCPMFLDERYIHEYWDRLGRIRHGGESPEQLINEYDFLIKEILEHAGITENDSQLTDAMVKLAKAIARQKSIRIDNPEEFYANTEKVKQLLSIYAVEEVKEEDKLFKCPICRQGFVYQKDYVDIATGEVSPYYACEHNMCFRIFDNKIDEFFLHKKKNYDQNERLEALKNIASKQHLKNKGYLFTGLIGKNEKPYDAKIEIDEYTDNKQIKRFSLKVLFNKK